MEEGDEYQEVTGVRPERRRSPRADLEVPALIDAGHFWRKAVCRDVSACGLAITTDCELLAGQVVEIYFELPTRVPVEAAARVVANDQGCLRLSFLQLTFEQVAALTEYVSGVEAESCGQSTGATWGLRRREAQVVSLGQRR